MRSDIDPSRFFLYLQQWNWHFQSTSIQMGGGWWVVLQFRTWLVDQSEALCQTEPVLQYRPPRLSFMCGRILREWCANWGIFKSNHKGEFTVYTFITSLAATSTWHDWHMLYFLLNHPKAAGVLVQGAVWSQCEGSIASLVSQLLYVERSGLDAPHRLLNVAFLFLKVVGSSVSWLGLLLFPKTFVFPHVAS